MLLNRFLLHTFTHMLSYLSMSTVLCVDAVEVGFTTSGYTVSESEGSVMVCVEVKSGELTPSDVALLTLNTASGSALGKYAQTPYGRLIIVAFSI